MLRAAVLLASALGLAACGGLQWPPPPQLANPPARATSANTLAQPKTVTVGDSETLFSLARRYNVAARAIIEANNLQPPYRLIPGQRLTLPAPRIHTVVRGDTLYGISRFYGVDAYELARANMLLPPYTIRVNQQLVLPGGEPRQPAAIEVADRGAAPAPVQAPQPAVRKVEVVDEVSAGTRENAARGAVAKEIAAPALPPGAAPAGPAPPADARPEPPAKTELASLPPQPAMRGRAGVSRFIWPLQGKIASEYGPKGDGLHNDGINIAAPKGTPVLAAAPGIVAYAGNEIRGFGNLLLIRHADGWMTAYAHNDALLVKRGDQVRQGQEIARVGATGNVVSPQLHFEIRRGKRAVDPLDQLASQKS